MNKPRIPAELSAMLAALLSGDGTFIQIDPNSKLSIDEQIAEAEAKHRETCAGCRADYELAQKEKAKAEDLDKCAAASEPTKAEIDAAVVAAKLAQANMKKPHELNKEEFLAERAAKAREVLGYMVFVGDDPIGPSFNKSEEKLEQHMEKFMDDPLNKVLAALGKLPEVKIKPVYL